MAEYDLFAVGGQSNAVGRGVSANSPDPSAGNAIEYRYDTDDIQDPLDDPVDGNSDAADTGSAWPQFAADYYSHTNRPIAIVGAARGNTAQFSGADAGNGNWDDTGSLDDDLITYANNAISKIEAQGHTVTFQGILWHQGERDADSITDGNMTKSDYKTALENMIGRFRSEFGAEMPFWLFEVGHETNDSGYDGDSVGYQEVRAAQQEVVLAQDYTYLISDKQKDFPDDGLMSDGVHYNQTGYNEMGSVGALNVATKVNSSTTELRLLSGTESQNGSYTGAEGEPVVDTTDDRLVIHDGSTAGGHSHAKKSEL